MRPLTEVRPVTEEAASKPCNGVQCTILMQLDAMIAPAPTQIAATTLQLSLLYKHTPRVLLLHSTLLSCMKYSQLLQAPAGAT